MKGSFIQRSSNTRSVRVRILLICEGEKTEPQYFNELRQEYRHPWLEMRHAPSDYTDPQNLVTFARDTFLKGYNNGHGHKFDAKAFDEVYILFDRDDHQGYAAALQKAKDIEPGLRNDFKKRIIFMALPSSPCFELWLVLHYKDVSNLPPRAELFDDLKRCWGGYEKGAAGTFAKTKDLLPKACKRAADLNQKSTPLSNDKGYTGVVTLVERVRTLHERYVRERSILMTS